MDESYRMYDRHNSLLSIFALEKLSVQHAPTEHKTNVFFFLAVTPETTPSVRFRFVAGAVSR